MLSRENMPVGLRKSIGRLSSGLSIMICGIASIMRKMKPKWFTMVIFLLIKAGRIVREHGKIPLVLRRLMIVRII